MRTIFAEYNPKRNSIDVYTSVGYMLRIDCWEAEKNLKTTPGSDCALNALAIDEPLEYARLYLDGNLLDVSVHIFPDSPILFLLSLYARNRIVRNVTVSAARREIQVPFNPNNFASITAQITIATIPLRNDPTIAIFGSSTAEKYATSTTLIPATINPRKYRRSPVCA